MAASKPSKTQQRLKVSVRRLPPDLPAEVFWRTAAPWVSREGQAEGERQEGAETVAWAEYKAGKVRKRYVLIFIRSSRTGGAPRLCIDIELHAAGRTRTASTRELTSPSRPFPHSSPFIERTMGGALGISRVRCYFSPLFDATLTLSSKQATLARLSSSLRRTLVLPSRRRRRMRGKERLKRVRFHTSWTERLELTNFLPADAEFLAFAEMLKAAPAPVQPPTESSAFPFSHPSPSID